MDSVILNNFRWIEIIKLCKKPAPFAAPEVSSEALFAVLGHEQTAERLLALDGPCHVWPCKKNMGNQLYGLFMGSL